MSFAEALYDILYHAQTICGFPKAKDRKFLQWVGTEWARNIDPDVWVRVVEKKIRDWDQEVIEPSIIITDVRFPNEAKMLKDNGFTLVRILRDDKDANVDRKHASENSLLTYDGWDHIIENNGTLEEFYEELDGLVALRM